MYCLHLHEIAKETLLILGEACSIRTFSQIKPTVIENPTLCFPPRFLPRVRREERFERLENHLSLRAQLLTVCRHGKPLFFRVLGSSRLMMDIACIAISNKLRR